MYEEIPQLHSDQSNEYVDTNSSYHTHPLESEYSESEQGLFLVQVNAHSKPLVVSKDSKVFGCKSNKKFYTFYKKLPEYDYVRKAKDNNNSNVVITFTILILQRRQHMVEHLFKANSSILSMILVYSSQVRLSNHINQID